ncbi:MAG: Type 1 glutamine amidotransferase-like domain-containing protein, partial [Nanoarchaeota archaeon]|nr:Type 1 glutamine amidotransferase-like domain-containing protein [Nanoarchaeota archaeon]
MKGKLMIIGGGETFEDNTKINKRILEMTNKNLPKILFIPTASCDAFAYWENFEKHFNKLGGKSDVLFLIKEKPTKKEIENKILNSDAIYIGGGNTLMMMKLWRKLGIDKLLLKAYKKGIVLSGLSAGSICWFKYGTSDS